MKELRLVEININFLAEIAKSRLYNFFFVDFFNISIEDTRESLLDF